METKTFDVYEFIGVITPGAVVALLLVLQWPDLKSLIGTDGFSVGDLGLFTIVAFVLGHLVQALGNIIDTAFWAIQGMPSAWVRSPKQSLITPAQRDLLQSKVSAMEGASTDLAALKRGSWRTITRRAYGRVNAAGKASRVDTFNRTYGLSRGLVAAFLLAAAWLAYDHPDDRTPAAVALTMALLALWRMYLAGKLYARTLFQAFIEL